MMIISQEDQPLSPTNQDLESPTAGLVALPTNTVD